MLPSFFIALNICCSTIVTLAVHQFLFTKKYYFRHGLMLHTFLASISIGIFIVALYSPIANKQHYTHILSANQYYLLQGRVIEQTAKTDFGTTFKIKIISADHQKVNGEMLCFFPSKISSDIIKAIEPNNELVFIAKCEPIAPPKNPYQFDYKTYMERKGIYWRAYIQSIGHINQNSKSKEIKSHIEYLRNYLANTIDKHFNNESASVLKTLLLGKRNDLDEELYQNYVDAGAVHILAISGLHVGIITSILLFFLQKIPNTLLSYRLIRYLTLSIGLWAFALIAGSSPSVLRATLMFNLIGLSLLIRDKGGRFDSLMLSMLFLLLINPSYLYDVSFQLSYAAVFSILTFYPIALRWWFPENKYVRYLWSLVAVGFTAQIVVIPISLYYFHQFSILFFISNLVVVPLLQPILILGILCLLLASTVGLPNIIIFITEKLIWLMNTVIRLIAEQEFFIIRNIQFNTLTLIASLLIVISIIWWRHYLHQKAVKAILISIFILQVVLFYNKYQLSTTEEMLIFSKYKEKVIAIRQGQRLKVFQNDTLSLSPMLKNYMKQKGITNISLQKMPYLLHFKEKNYLLMDSMGIYPTSKQVVIDSVIFVQQTPKINLDRMKQDLSLRY
ncbi:ComEC/Rec2 family competence protein [Capnocytophaga leadbetteri]|uniref:ComEC/Rec2 family competence protein n=1 Tax=Capnocytophaga leadbetteri TaxID=327575 RepID=UPI0028E2B4DD|nr:ComEC/Rec2 family competence protein [Capnocytophaga leadbetteri]